MPELKSRYRVEGMDCASCASKIDTAVRRLPDVQQVSVSVGAGTMTVDHGQTFDQSAMKKTLRGLGYQAEEITDISSAKQDGGLVSKQRKPQRWWQTPKARLTIGSGLALAVAYVVGRTVPSMDQWAFIIAMLIGLIPIVRRAFMAALSGSPFSIETLMSIAAIGAVFIGAVEEAATVVFLFLIGELLEGVAAGRARASIQGLADLVPKVALIERNGNTVSVPAGELGINDTLMVRPGDRIAADGVITEGSSEIDEAPVTGESTPKRKTIGDTVFAGTINTDGVLRVKVTATAEDNTVARIVRLVEEAQESKAPTERFIDRFSRYYTPGVMAVALLVAIVPPLLLAGNWNEWIYKGLAVLLIGCPCALVISTPAAIAAGLSAGARRGLLMKGGAVLESLGKITAVAFDKTGTLTEGKPVVTDVISFGMPENQIVSLAAALEAGSSHPLAKAILNRAETAKLPVPPANSAEAISGKGVRGKVGGKEVFFGSPNGANAIALLSNDQERSIAALNNEGKTVSALVVDGQLAGLIAMRDEPRGDAKPALARLNSAGIKTVMLTGDNARTAKAIAEALGIEPKADLLPQDKQKLVREMQRDGYIVAKVGDGINDAPALATANIGIAMGGGTDVALETADAAVLHGRVADIPDMITLSKKVMTNIGQNITVALGLKAVFLVTTVIGVTGLWPAILADTGATVLVTANAMRLLGWKGNAIQ